jgi:hypothetical protein
MKIKSKITKKTLLILVLILVASAVLGVGIQYKSSQQDVNKNYALPIPQPTPSSIWDIFDEEELDMTCESNESDEQELDEQISQAEHEPVSNRIEPETEFAMLDSDFIWFDEAYASCYDLETDLWLVYETSVGRDIFGNRTVYRYDATDSRWDSFASKSPDDLQMIKRQILQSGNVLHLFQWNNGTVEEHTKKGSTVRLGSGQAWFNENGADCYGRARNLDLSISVEGGRFSCAVSGGIPPIAYDWRSDRDGQSGGASSFEPELLNGTHSIMLVVTDASGRTATDTVEVQVT